MTYHVRRPTELASDENARKVGDTVRDDDFLDLVTKSLLYSTAEVVEFSNLGLMHLLLRLLQLKTVF